jgi:protein-tyrosine-phosphatase
MFVCSRGAGRSKLAEAFWRDAGGDARARALQPASVVYPAAVKAMAEIGMELDLGTPQEISSDDLAWADLVVRIDCHARDEFPSELVVLDWPLEQPSGEGVDALRVLRDAIRDRVDTFARSFRAPFPP